MKTNQYYKSLFITIALLLSTSFVYAGANDKALEAAISKGVGENYCYQAEIKISYYYEYNQRNLKHKLGKFFEKRKGYRVAKASTVGKKNDRVDVDFIPEEDYYKYVLYFFCKNIMLSDAKPIKNRGKVFSVYRKNTNPNPNSWFPHYETFINPSPKEVYWTGEVVNGFINGEGYALFYNTNPRVYEKKYKQWVLVAAKYICGIPVSDVVWYTLDDYGRPEGIISEKSYNKEPKMDAPSIKYLTSITNATGEFKYAIDTRVATERSDIPEKYIQATKQLLKNGGTPLLSETIGGQLGFTRIGNFYVADKESAQKRVIFSEMSNTDSKALEALYFMDMQDGLYFASTDNANSAKKYLDDSFVPFDQSKYWDKMTRAMCAVDKLKNMSSTQDVQKELNDAAQKINSWGETIFAARSKHAKESASRMGNFLANLWNDAVQSAKSSYYSSSSTSEKKEDSSSSSSYSNSTDIDIENISIPSFKYLTEWKEEGIISNNTARNKSGENQVREIKFDDGTEGKIHRVIGSDGYWAAKDRRYSTLDDAIAAEYVYQKYGKYREKGRMHGVLY